MNRSISTILALIYYIVKQSLSIIKTYYLYRPLEYTERKYNAFHKKMIALVGSPDNIDHTSICTRDSMYLDTLYLKNPSRSGCIIYFHGNCGNMTIRHDMIKFLYHYSSVVVFDYRGYGRSSGTASLITEATMIIDATAMWKFTRGMYQSCDITLFGESLGAAIASNLTYHLSKEFNSNDYPRALILHSPFKSLESMTSKITSSNYLVPLIKVILFFLGGEYDNTEYLNMINRITRVMIVHSVHDDVVPYSEAKELHASLDRTDIQFITIYGSHNSPKITDDYVYALESFLDY